jgi:hypothetical protein
LRQAEKLTQVRSLTGNKYAKHGEILTCCYQ